MWKGGSERAGHSTAQGDSFETLVRRGLKDQPTPPCLFLPPCSCSCLPACRHLVCVGDNRHTYLYQATPVCYRQCAVYTEAGDAGMCAAWSASGEGGSPDWVAG